MAASSIQLVAAAAAIANDGILMQPHIVKAIRRLIIGTIYCPHCKAIIHPAPP